MERTAIPEGPLASQGLASSFRPTGDVEVDPGGVSGELFEEHGA